MSSISDEDGYYNLEYCSIPNQLERLEKIAVEKYGGHLTIMRFSTHWKCFFRTPDLRSGKDNDWIYAIKGYKTLQAALDQLETDYHREQKYQPSFRVSEVPKW